MERKDISLARRCSKKVVIVVDGRSSDFCSGFVLKSSDKSTYIVTSTQFVEEREKDLKVCFFDGIELSASVFVKGSFFAVLRTNFHRHCEEITVMEGDLTPSRIILFPPSSTSSIYHIPGFIILESVDAYQADILDDEAGPTSRDHIPVSERYFQLTCRYGDKCIDGHSRLVGAPVFNMKGEVVGIVTGDFRPKEGYEHVIKLGLCAKYIWDRVHALVPGLVESKNGRNEGSSGSKRKSNGKRKMSRKESATKSTKRQSRRV